jgi:acetyl esterase
MPVDPHLRVMLDAAAARAAAAAEADPAAGQLSPQILRAGYRMAILAALGEDYAPAPLAEVRDTELAGVPVRVYHPEPGHPEPAQPLPVVAFAHAGGWVLGDLETHDEVCRHLSAALPAVVVAVDYRLAPEHVYPAAINDYWSVVCWLAEHATELGADPDRLIVAGDSAGGNMALAAALRAREAGGPRIAAQAAAYPATDLTLGYGGAPGRSYEKYAVGYGLTAAVMAWFADTYLPSTADRASQTASPLLADDLSGLPPAVIATAEYDPLADEGARYAERLRAAGVPVTYLAGQSLVHGFLYYPRVSPACATARDAFTDAIRSAVTRSAQKGRQHVG